MKNHVKTNASSRKHDTLGMAIAARLGMIGMLAVAFGLFDIVGTLLELVFVPRSPTQQVESSMANLAEKSLENYSDLDGAEANESNYMYECVRYMENFRLDHFMGQLRQVLSLLWHQVQLDIIIICVGAFLVTYDLRPCSKCAYDDP